MPSLQARLRAYFFSVRSMDRNAAIDARRIATVAIAVASALRSAQIEYANLCQRLAELRVSTVMTMGNGDDDYLDREAADSERLNALETELAIGDCRLTELATMIGDFRFLKTALSTRFPTGGSPSALRLSNDELSKIEFGPLVICEPSTRSSWIGPQEMDRGEDVAPNERVHIDV